MELGTTSPAARQYVDDIPPSNWRSTTWLDDDSLPPRYGIVSTNMSESMNNMLEEAREVSWLESVDLILTKIVSRSSTLRSVYREERGLVDEWESRLQERWDNCAGFSVHEIEENGHTFLIQRPNTTVRASNRNHTIDVRKKWCSCGQWQEHQVPCIDACAYYRLHEEKSIQYVKTLASVFYCYESMNAIFQRSFIPVIIDNLNYDGITLPPTPSLKRKSGRPKKVRLRSRHKGTKKITIVCSHCKQPGHNVRTCAARQALAAQNGGTGGTQDEDGLDLS